MLAAYGETGSSRTETADSGLRSSRFRKIAVPDGRAEWIARAVRDMLSGDPGFDNPIRVVIPGEPAANTSGFQPAALKSRPVSGEKTTNVRIHTAETLFASTESELEEAQRAACNDQSAGKADELQ